jgi:hypothetical protein
MVDSYYLQDFIVYGDLFKKHSIRITEMMRILDDCIKDELGIVTIRTRDLYRMTMDMTYAVDQLYRKEKGIDEKADLIFPTLCTKDDYLAEMRTLLSSELDRYFNGTKE